MVRKERGY